MENILILKNIFEETKKDYNNIIIIDVESTCWKDDKDKKDQQSEIIEIGICQINDGVLIKRPSIFIIPEHSTVSPFCTSLTSLTQNQIEKNGLTPKLAYNKLQKEFIYNTWGSYGEYDKNMIIKMLELYKLPNILPNKHINIRKVASEVLKKSENPKDVPSNPKETLELVGLKFKGKNHRGDDDAYNIANLYVKLRSIKK